MNKLRRLILQIKMFIDTAKRRRALKEEDPYIYK